MPAHTVIAALLRGALPLGSTVTVKGWLRSKRDSKAGISFLAVHDGSAFDAIQAVVPETLANYRSEVLPLTTGCAVSLATMRRAICRADWTVKKSRSLPVSATKSSASPG